MKFLAGLSALATLATAATMKRDSPLDVKLESIGNTGLQATVTNTGNDALKIFKTGSLFDSAPVEKVQVFKGDSQVDFAGIRLRITTAGLDEEAFLTIPAGESIKTLIDVGELHDLSEGGEYNFVANGVLSYADANTTAIAGVVPFSSNSISATVDGAQAAEVQRRFVEKRTVVQSDCTGAKKTAQTTALSNCASLAKLSASAAQSDSAKVVEYFKTASAASTLVTVFNRVASECGSTTSGVSKQYCTDVYSSCSSGVLAYTLPSGSFMVSCPLYFNYLPALTKSCHAQDQATTTLHEVTHLSQIKGTQDLGYGYSAAIRLSATQALNNADSYALFANAVYAGC
ncbi:Neutral protease 2 [Pestalotiopsis fici W106-1]|uniref:Neutral protease 2 n=1 Tax=Pestalotiopsis fici (strain W106-1 / CGMCC3.15140) TaxID=1229662 RepID=W3WK66_PESFW|nr:Neutral protease 2 [Pestalotiopsis fici W106-1]ETS73211.1 Neutral protease 2 [Pestalotiopsis fici W106-1]